MKALVTGATSGIGRAVALQLARDGELRIVQDADLQDLLLIAAPASLGE